VIRCHRPSSAHVAEAQPQCLRGDGLAVLRWREGSDRTQVLFVIVSVPGVGEDDGRAQARFGHDIQMRRHIETSGGSTQLLGQAKRVVQILPT
jgi:hypothetical protein